MCFQGYGKPKAKRWDRTFVADHALFGFLAEC